MGRKLTISVPDEVAEEVRSAVRAGQASSVSGYVVAARWTELGRGRPVSYAVEPG